VSAAYAPNGPRPIDEAHEKKKRAERFLQVLERHQIPLHGAQTRLAKQVGVSEATIAAWMKGSLPRDPVNLIKFCDEYDVDIYWWVNGESRPRMSLDIEKLVRAGRKVDVFAEDHELTLTNEQRTLLMGNVYKNPKEAEDTLATMARFFQQPD